MSLNSNSGSTRPARSTRSRRVSRAPSPVREPMVDTIEPNSIETSWELGKPLYLGIQWPVHRLPLEALTKQPVSFIMEPSQVEWDVARQAKAAAMATSRQLDWSRTYWAANVAQHTYHRFGIGEMTSGEVGTHVSKDVPNRNVQLNHDKAIEESLFALDSCTAAKKNLEKAILVLDEVLERDLTYGGSGVTTSTHPRKRVRNEDKGEGSSQGRASRRRVSFKDSTP
ncbi:hypothetical protein BGX34_001383 [Mortierella sp. NVP85]|nr:hypothetical protein BGX34_001383 [Mortierella sp. NVP85]